MAHPLPLTAALACLAGVWLLILTYRVIYLRRAGGVVIGDNGDRAMQKAIRAHGNAAEQVPIFVILMGLAELGGASATALIAVAVVFWAGRLAHGAYFGWHGLHWRLRFWGMLATSLGQAGAILLLGTALLG